MQALEKLIVSPETGPEEDKTLRQVLNLVTSLRDSQEPAEEPEPVQEGPSASMLDRNRGILQSYNESIQAYNQKRGQA